MKASRENQFQFLRVLAFLNVYLLHANNWNIIGYPSWFGGISAVVFFFMLSGFLTGFAYDDSKAELNRHTYFAYMKRKIQRFYPVYFLVTMYAIVYSEIPPTFAKGHFGELIGPVVQLGKNLLCIQPWFSDGFFSYYGPGWFSASLLALYALNLPFFVLIRRIRRCRRANAILALLMAAGFAGTAVYCYATRNGALQFLHYIHPVSRVGVYLGSMLFGVLIRPAVMRLREGAGHTLAFTTAEAASLVFWFVMLFFPGAGWMEWNVTWILPNLLVLAAFAFGKGRLSRLFSCRPLVALGNVSMECYMVHLLVLRTYSRVNSFDLSYTLGCMFSLAACLALTFMISFVLNRSMRRQA